MKTSEWTAALRSGDFKQTQRRLNSDGGFCCLGVLCEVKGLPKTVILGEPAYVFDEDVTSHAVIPAAFKDKMLEDLDLSMMINQGHSNEDQLAGVLMQMNDDGYTFNEIADYIDGVVA